jgi:hypothetical protein
MMSEVNVLWSSPWLTLQKNLAVSLAEASDSTRSACKPPVRIRPLTAASWLVRARSRKMQLAPIAQ